MLMVNNLGATPAMELAIVARRAISRLESEGLVVERVLSGTFSRPWRWRAFRSACCPSTRSVSSDSTHPPMPRRGGRLQPDP